MALSNAIITEFMIYLICSHSPRSIVASIIEFRSSYVNKSSRNHNFGHSKASIVGAIRR